MLIRPGSCPLSLKVVIGDHSWIGDKVTLYSIATSTIGEHSVVSQEAYLCAGTHDHSDISFASPITINRNAGLPREPLSGQGFGLVAVQSWLLDVPPATIVTGVPARTVGIRRVRNGDSDSFRLVPGRISEQEHRRIRWSATW